MNACVLAIANQKGGVGKTTSALSLAAALGRAGKKVLLLDMDPHVCASVHLRLYPEEHKYTLHTVFSALSDTGYGDGADNGSMQKMWDDAIIKDSGRTFDVVCGDTRLAEIEGDMRGQSNRGFLLQQALQIPRETYEYIILDCPPQMSVLLVNALVGADWLIIPIQTDFLALHGLKLLFDTIRTLNKVLQQPIRYKALPTMFDKRTKACKQILAMLQEKMGSAVLDVIIPMDTRFREASALGQVVYDINPYCQGAIAYTKLADEVMDLC